MGGLEGGGADGEIKIPLLINRTLTPWCDVWMYSLLQGELLCHYDQEETREGRGGTREEKGEGEGEGEGWSMDSDEVWMWCAEGNGDLDEPATVGGEGDEVYDTAMGYGLISPEPEVCTDQSSSLSLYIPPSISPCIRTSPSLPPSLPPSLLSPPSQSQDHSLTTPVGMDISVSIATMTRVFVNPLIITYRMSGLSLSNKSVSMMMSHAL